LIPWRSATVSSTWIGQIFFEVPAPRFAKVKTMWSLWTASDRVRSEPARVQQRSRVATPEHLSSNRMACFNRLTDD
jgi:hypothetical protein